MTKEELGKTEEYDLIIRFKSNKPKYEIRDYIIKHTLNEFDNLQMWDFKRSSEFAESREKQIQIDAEQIRALQKQNGELTDELTKKADTNHSLVEQMADLEEENAELKSIAEFQQSSNMSRHFENKKLKEGLAVGSTFNKALNSMNKNLEEERDKYRNMVFDKDDQLTKAKELLKKLLSAYTTYADSFDDRDNEIVEEAEQFISEV